MDKSANTDKNGFGRAMMINFLKQFSVQSIYDITLRMRHITENETQPDYKQDIYQNILLKLFFFLDANFTPRKPFEKLYIQMNNLLIWWEDPHLADF